MLVQSKSILAKLLASENIRVEHRKVPTAYFDTKNRIMVLPIWKDMSSDLYDLLLGHETGHAIFTPPDGWHDQLKNNHSRAFKTYLNVIEDIRIEKRIQEKFPGLKTPFTKGYNELMSNDFFGVNSMGKEVDELAFIDRINLHYKVGAYLNVKFSPAEKIVLERLDKLKTWEEVEVIANELFEQGKKELRDQLEQMFENGMGDDDTEFEYSDEDIDSDDWDNDDLEDGDRNGRMRTRNKGSKSEDEEPVARTDEHFRAREKDLMQDNVKPYYYVDRPTPNLKAIIVPYHCIKKHYNNFRNAHTGVTEVGEIEAAKNHYMKKFYETNKKYISYLIKEFELRRNARQFARASVSKTGELDVKKVFSYKINDDLFKRMTVVPQGKSHGLVMFIDYSGSMTDNIQATIEQTLVLATFCRKVNIPFRVYAFTDHIPDSKTIADELGYDDHYNYANYLDNYRSLKRAAIANPEYVKFSSNDGEMDLNANRGFRLREYLSSEMSGSEFKNALKYWLLVGEMFVRRSYRWKTDEHTLLPSYRNSSFEQLNGTPLNEAIVASTEIVQEFKRKYRLDVVNTVFLTDGESNETNERYDNEKDYSVKIMPHNQKDCNVIIRDVKSSEEGKKPPRAELTHGLLNLLKAITGVNIIGFFLVPDSRSHRRTIQYRIESSGSYVADFDEKFKKFKNDKFFMLNNIGYDDYYIIPGGDELEIKDDGLDGVDSNSSKTDLKRAFMKMQKSKSVNRVLLNRFVEKIA